MFIIILGINAISFKTAKSLAGLNIQIVLIGDQKQLSSLLQKLEPKDQNFCHQICVIAASEKELGNILNNHQSFDACFCIGAPWILKKDTIEHVFQNKILNLHGTHLPKYRGGTLFSWQILTGQKTGICLLHQLTPQIDAGPIIAYKEFIYPVHCRKPIDYIEVYEEKNVEFLLQLISNWNGFPEGLSQQPEYLSSYFPRLLAPVHGWINWDWDNLELERFILAFDEPYGGARCLLNGEVVILRDVYAQQTDGYFHPFQYGTIYRNNGEWLTVAAKNGELLIKQVYNEAGVNITADIKAGDKFYTTNEQLSQTHHRVIKTKNGLSRKL